MTAFKKSLIDNLLLNFLFIFFQWLSSVFNLIILFMLVKNYLKGEFGPQMILAYMWFMNICSFSFACAYVYFLPNRMAESKFFADILFDGRVTIEKTIFQSIFNFADPVNEKIIEKDREIQKKFTWPKPKQQQLSK